MLAAVLVAGTVAAVQLSQTLDASDRTLGVALPGLLTLGVAGTGACSRIGAAAWRRAASR